MLRTFILIYTPLLLISLVGIDTVRHILIVVYEQELEEDLGKDHQGLFMLLEHLYPKVDEVEWLQLLEDMTNHSNIPLKSHATDVWNLSEDARAIISQGKIFVENGEDGILYKKIAEDMVVRIGPMQTIESLEQASHKARVGFLVVLCLLVLLWAGWKQYQTEMLVRATRRFSEQDLQARAPVGWRGIHILSEAFNAMAERIERLFLSHRHLTNAVSHELRSPIAKIRFQLELLDGTIDKAERDRLMLGISDDLDDMDALVEEMLTYAKMERSEPMLSIENGDLCEWLREQAQRLLGEVTIALELVFPDTSLPAQFDKHLLARMLRNLVCNADRYAKTRIEIGVEASGSHCHLWIDDDGPGIPEGERSRLFEPFTRLDESRNRDTGRYGLGLAIATQVARCHAGSLTITDSPLGGARFLFVWPRFQCRAGVQIQKKIT